MNQPSFEDEPRQTSSPTYEKKRRSPVAAIVALIVALALIVAGVLWFVNRDTGTTNGGGGGTIDPSVPPVTPSGSDGELTIGMLLEPTNLNIRETAGVALDQLLVDNVYEGLVTFVPGTTEIRMLLAESYELNDDATRYEFKLRESVTFHSGNPLTAEDVVASLQTTIADATIEASDEHTVVIELTEPNSLLLPTLASRLGVILEAAATNDLANSANGTGPYLLEEWKQGDSATLVKNPDYWGEEATLERVVYRYIPDAKAAVNASLDGDLDVQLTVQPTLRAEFEGTHFNLVPSVSTDVFTLAYNNARPPLDNPRVRQALSMAIDTEAIIEALGGDGQSLGGPITSIEPGYEDLTAINAYNPDESRRILEEEGIGILNLTVTAPNFYETTALDVVATQFAEIGVTLTINQVEFGTWLEDVYTNKDYDLSYVDHAEGFDFENYANPNYYFGYNNPEVQSLYAEAVASRTLDEAAPLLKQAARVVAADAPAKWLYNYNATNAVASYVKGFPEHNTNSRINLEGVTIVR